MASDKLIQHFLIIYDHEAGELLDMVKFGNDGERAVAAYASKEKEYQDRKKIEIVLIGSDSEETVELTHANYFDGSLSQSKYLVGI